MNGQMPFDYTGQQNSVARRQKLADALLMQAFQPRQINQGGFGGALQALQPLMAAMLSQKLGAKADAEQAELGQRYRNDMAQGLQKYFATREGNPGTPMGPPTEEGAMGLTGATNPDPRRAAIEALTSNLPGLQKLGEMELMGKNDESFSNPVTERGQDGKLISVQYGNRGSRRVVAGSVPFEKPMSVADRVIDPAKVFAGYRWMRDDGTSSATAASSRNNVYWVGGLYRVTPALALTGAAYYTDTHNSNNDPWMFVLSADYSFSKRTDAYLNLGYVRNKGTSALGLNGANTAVAGANQTGAVVGIRHRF